MCANTGQNDSKLRITTKHKIKQSYIYTFRSLLLRKHVHLLGSDVTKEDRKGETSSSSDNESIYANMLATEALSNGS